MEKESNFGQLWASIMFIISGILFLIDQLITPVYWDKIWPILLIATGILLIIETLKK